MSQQHMGRQACLKKKNPPAAAGGRLCRGLGARLAAVHQKGRQHTRRRAAARSHGDDEAQGRPRHLLLELEEEGFFGGALGVALLLPLLVPEIHRHTRDAKQQRVRSGAEAATTFEEANALAAISTNEHKRSRRARSGTTQLGTADSMVTSTNTDSRQEAESRPVRAFFRARPSSSLSPSSSRLRLSPEGARRARGSR
jgi:hypothetical protein